MKVLVTYASRHGGTQGIAERIATRLTAAGLDAEVAPVGTVRDAGPYDAFVVGSALYMFRWRGPASAYLRRNARVLAGKPVWLFSSGPLGPNPDGSDPRPTAGPKDLTELERIAGARDHRVFHGAWRRTYKPKGLVEQFTLRMPAARDAFPDGDFRDWPEIDAYADEIAEALVPATVG